MEFSAMVISVVWIIAETTLLVHYTFRTATCTNIGAFLLGLTVVPFIIYIYHHLTRDSNLKENDDSKSSVYDLKHGRLHINTDTPMWMNMGFWRVLAPSTISLRSVVRDEGGETEEEKNIETLAEASRNLLSEVLKTAGFSRKRKNSEHARKTTRKTKAIIDLGFGCGDQTVYLMALAPLQESDKLWWDSQHHVPILDSYTGITLDVKQFQYAQKRVDHLRAYGAALEPKIWPGKWSKGVNNTKIYCADASNPDGWSEELQTRVKTEIKQVDEPWVLALDTLYHFSPSRWPVVNYTSHLLQASFMAFDLCLADSVSYPNLLALRILTRFMGAPWANFVTKDQYREKLVEAGYRDIVIRDVSEQVFGPLASFLEGQGRRLEGIGLGLGPFHVAKWLFGWWGRTGIVRGVIVVAKHPSASLV